MADFYFQLLTTAEPALHPLLPLLETARSLPHGVDIHQYFQRLAACEQCGSLEAIAKLPLDVPTLPEFVPESMRKNLVLHGDVVQECRRRIAASSPVSRSAALTRALAALQRWREHCETLDDPEARVVQAIVENWSSILADVGEREGEGPREPLKNPYIAGNPVTGRLFVGRDAVFRRIEGLWHQRDDPPSILLYGHRRIGKSSILRNLGDHLDSTFYPVYVDMQGLRARSTEGAFFGISEVIHRELKLRAKAPQQPALEEFDREPYLRFTSFLNEIEPSLGGKRLILAIDEYELLAEKIESGVWEPDLLPYLRSLVQSQLRVTLIFAGLHTQEQMTRDYTHEFWSSVTPVSVSFLRRDDAVRLITAPSDDFAVDYDADAVEHILAATHGQPFLIQQICEALVIRLNEWLSHSGYDGELRIRREDVDEVMAHLVSEGRYYRGIWNQVETAAARRLLRILAADEGLGAEALAARVPESEAEVRETLRLLEDLDILASEATETGRLWRFQVELMRRWVLSEAEHDDSKGVSLAGDGPDLRPR